MISRRTPDAPRELPHRLARQRNRGRTRDVEDAAHPDLQGAGDRLDDVVLVDDLDHRVEPEQRRDIR